MQGEGMNEAIGAGDTAGAFAGMSPPANDASDTTGAQQHWLRFEAANYIESLLAELGAIARAAELQHLFYLLDMARHEAGIQAQHQQHER